MHRMIRERVVEHGVAKDQSDIGGKVRRRHDIARLDVTLDRYQVHWFLGRAGARRVQPITYVHTYIHTYVHTYIHTYLDDVKVVVTLMADGIHWLPEVDGGWMIQ